MRTFRTVACSILAVWAVGSTAFADVRVSMRDGRVSIAVVDATLAQVREEWAKIGLTFRWAIV